MRRSEEREGKRERPIETLSSGLRKLPRKEDELRKRGMKREKKE